MDAVHISFSRRDEEPRPRFRFILRAFLRASVAAP